MNLSLKFYGDPILRETAKPVETFDADLKKLAADMVKAMREEAGIGLAGPQIGRSLRVFVMEIPSDMDEDAEGNPLNPGVIYPLAVVNPELEPLSDEEDEREEGCLSIPDIRGKVWRPAAVRMKYQTVTGEQKELELHGLAARCAQHETDHLNGILFVDLLGSVKKMAIKGKLKKLKAQNDGGSK
ncbi:MAG: peptide deformylase [Kiritimatiellia bacterium]